MSRVSSTLRAIERRITSARPNLPIKILTYGTWDGNDGLYREGMDGQTYTEEEKRELEKGYQLIVICYSDWPPGDGKRIQMTWGDDDPLPPGVVDLAAAGRINGNKGE